LCVRGRNLRKHTIFAVFLPVLAGVLGMAAVTGRMTLDALVSSSRLVIYGRVMQARAERDPDTGTIWTRTEIMILDGIVGPAESTLVITEPGGRMGDRIELYPGVPRFLPGQEVVVFAYQAPGNRWRVTGQLQGLFVVETDRRSGSRMARPLYLPTETVYEEGSQAERDAVPTSGGGTNLSRFLFDIRQKAATR
jgi:hypothetical protein